MLKKEKRKQFADVPFFWQLLIIMLFVLGVVFIQQIISSKMYEKKLVKDYIQIETKHLEQNSDTLFAQINMAYAIPQAIEDSVGYRYLRAFTGEELPPKYFSVLSMLQSAFHNQVYLRENSWEGLIYLKVGNSVCTNSKVFLRAEECFDNYMVFEKTDSQELVSSLKKSGIIKILPMQQVSIVPKTMPATTKRVLSVIMSPANSNVSVLLIFPEDFILKSLGINESMPQGTELSIVSRDQTVIMDYTIGEAAESSPDDMVEISTFNSTMHYTVTMRIPKSYFTSELKSAVIFNYLILVLTIVISICLCILFAKKQSKPITDMVQNYEIDHDTNKSNELNRLDHILSYTKNEHSRIERMLFLNMLSRVFSGNVLSDSEEQEFAKHLPSDGEQYRVCILSVHESYSAALEEFMEQWKKVPGIYATPINMETWGILLQETGNELEPLQEFMKQNTKKAEIRCGISGRISAIDGFHSALRQAYMSYPSSAGCGIFSGENTEETGMDWRQHEQFYHALLTNNREKAFQILNLIQKNIDSVENAKGMFSILTFTMDSVAKEFGVSLPAEKWHTKYNPSLTPQANIMRLVEIVEVLFEQSNKQSHPVHSIQQDQVFKYVEDNYQDCNLCAASVAEHLGISEKNVYSITRQTLDMSFNEYLLSLRMRQAATLLCQTDFSVDQIAQKSGYQASSTFYRVFKKYYNETPSQYRIRKCTEAEE